MDALTAERYPIPEPDLPRKWRSTLTPEQTDHAMQELRRLAPQRLSIAILVDRLGISRGQVIRLAARVGVDLSSPAVTLPTIRDADHPAAATTAARRRARNEELIRLAADGWTDPQLAERFGISRNRVADIRSEHRQPAGWFRDRPDRKPKPKPGPEIPTPNPPDKAEELRLKADAQRRAYPPAGICPACCVVRDLLPDGRLKPHMRQGKPCRSTRPLPSYAAEEMAA